MEENNFLEQKMEELKRIKAIPDGDAREIAEEAFYASFVGWQYELFNKYYDAHLRLNQYIDFQDCPCEEEIPHLVNSLRECGVKHITISSGWSGLVDRMWALCNAGCIIEGMVEINSRDKDWNTGERRKQPAFLLNVGEKGSELMIEKDFNPFYDSDFLISRECSDDLRMLVELSKDELVQLRLEIDAVLEQMGASAGVAEGA